MIKQLKKKDNSIGTFIGSLSLYIKNIFIVANIRKIIGMATLTHYIIIFYISHMRKELGISQ